MYAFFLLSSSSFAFLLFLLKWKWPYWRKEAGEAYQPNSWDQRQRMKCDQFQTRCNAINAQKQLEFSMGFGNPQLQPQLQLQIQPTHFNDDDDDDDTSYQIVEKPNKKQTQN